MAESLKERKKYIDVLRGIGIILVILGHCDIPDFFKIWIYSFHMPLFFFLSGYVQKNTSADLKEQLKTNIMKLLYPYYVLGICIIVFNTLCGLIEDHVISEGMLLKRIIALLYGNCIWENNYDYIGTLWFLAALFVIKTIYSFICKLETVRSRLFVALIIFALGCIWRIPFNYGIRLPYSLDVALIALIFYVTGNVAGTSNFFDKDYKSTKAVFFFVIFLTVGSAMAFINCSFSNIERTDIYGMNIGNPIFYYLTAMLIIVSLLNITKFICSKLSGGILLELFIHIGRRSLLIMVVHLYVIKVFAYIFKLFYKTSINGFAIAGIALIISFIISVLIEKYFSFLYKVKK